MSNREKVIKGLECCMSEKICENKCPYKGECDTGGYYYSKAIDDAISLLKEQEEKPLRCDKCNYHREDGWCGMHRRWVKETDYCSLGAWKGR